MGVEIWEFEKKWLIENFFKLSINNNFLSVSIYFSVSLDELLSIIERI